MRKTLTAAIACLAVGASMIPQAALAQRYIEQERYIGQYCSNHPGDPDCTDWDRNRDSWDEARYNRWYSDHHDEFGPDDAAAALFGFAAGAAGAAAGAITGSIGGAVEGSHQAACAARYRSYDPAERYVPGERRLPARVPAVATNHNSVWKSRLRAGSFLRVPSPIRSCKRA